MTPEDAELWKQVTEGITPTVFAPMATVIRPFARFRAAVRQPSTALDLHGLTVNQAHTETLHFISAAFTHSKLKYVIVITGLSGVIRREFPLWIENRREVRRIEPLNGGGAFKVYLIKRN